LQLLRNIYASHAEQGSSELRNKVIDTLKPGNYEFLMKALAFLANNDLVFDGQVLSTRFMTPLRHVQSPLTQEDIEYLAENMKAADVEIKKDEKNPNVKHKTVNINFAPFMRTLLRSAPEIEEAFRQRNEFLAEERNKYNFGDDISNVSSEIDPEEEARKAREAEEER